MESIIQPIELGGIISGAIIVGAFAGFWFPKELESVGEGRLPRNFRVRLLFAMMNVIFFIFILTVVFISAYAPVFVKIVLAPGRDELKVAVDLLEKIRSADETNISLIVTGLGIFFGLFGLQKYRQIQAGTLRQLHNVSLVEEDETKLSELLKTCDYPLADLNDEPGIVALDQLQQRLAPDDAKTPALSLAVKAKKVTSLLRLWVDDDTWSATLPRADQPKLEAINLAHQRRMRLASRVIEHIEKIERGERDPAALAEIIAALDTGKLTSDDVVSKLKEMSNAPPSDNTDNRSIQQIIRPLVEFLDGGYNEQLNELSVTTAKATIMSGDDAQNKLNDLQLAHFTGIGRIEIIDLHRAVLIMTLIFVFVLVVFFAASNLVPFLVKKPNQGGQPFIFVIASSITLASVIGTMVGGLRNLANASEPPWAWYFLAAFAAAAAHVAAVLAASVLNLTIAGASPNYQPVQFAMAGSLVPFFVVISICLLSRRGDPHGGLRGRFADALSCSLIMLAAGIVFNIVVELAGLPPPRADAEFSDRMMLIGFVTFSVGAFIGAVVVHHVRGAALSSVVVEETPAEISAT